MSGPEFFQTVIGRRFYEGQIPKLIDTLERIAVALEAIVAKNDPEKTEKNDA